MNMLLTLISAHLLTIIENLLIADEPQIVAAAEQEVALLITKLESYLKKSSPVAAEVITPVLNGTQKVFNTGLNAAASAVAVEAKN